MTALGDELWRQYGGDVPADPRSVARDAIQRHGSGRAAARALGVDEKTIRRWKAGETRHSDNVDRFAREARQAKAETHSGHVDLTFRHAKRDRKLSFGTGAGGKRGLKPHALDAMKDAYVRGDKEGMASAFVKGVDDPWYRRMFARAEAADGEGMPGAEPGEDSDAVGVFLRR